MNSATTKQSHLRRWLFCWLVLASVLAAACAPPNAPIELSGHTMGTTWHVTVSNARLNPEDTLQSIEGILGDVNRSMSTYLSDSEISKFNQAAQNEWVSVSSGFLIVLKAALQVGDASGGAYDVTIGPVVDLWGFGPEAGSDVVPDKMELLALLAHTGQAGLQLDENNQSILKIDDLSLDFSSIAKGYGVDQVADWLASQGVQNYLVEVGGEMRLAGTNPRGEAWRIAIEQPDSSMGTVARAISLSDNALATSGDYRNYFEVAGKRYSHTIDPRTGYPIEHDLVSVTVVHPRAMTADAWATAFMVMGVEQAMKVALEQDLAVYFIRRTGESYNSSYSPRFEHYLDATH